MYMLNGWWFLSSGGSYPPVFMVGLYPQTIVLCFGFMEPQLLCLLEYINRLCIDMKNRV